MGFYGFVLIPRGSAAVVSYLLSRAKAALIPNISLGLYAVQAMEQEQEQELRQEQEQDARGPRDAKLMLICISK